jgi:hypothetical protein
MSERLSSGNSWRALSAGNAVTAGVKLYRSHLKLYLGLALRATLWSLLPLLALVPLLLLIINDRFDLSDLWLVAPLWSIFLLYCHGRSLINSVSISRLGFQESIDRPESIKTARAEVKKRFWSLLFSSVLGFLIIFAWFILVYILLSLVFAVILLISRPAPGVLEQNPLAIISIWLVFISTMTWIFAKLIVSEVLLAIEPNLSATKAIGRSWKLTNRSVFRIQIIQIVAFLISLPIFIVAQLLYIEFQNLFIIEMLSKIILNPVPAYIFWVLLFSIVVFYILMLAINLLVLPLWQSVKAVIYYDLRIRNEGLGLRLRELPAEENW